MEARTRARGSLKGPLSWVSLALGLSLFTAGEAALAQEDTETARVAYEQGMDALEEERFRDAVNALEQSYQLRPVPIVLFNLGIAYRGLGQARSAIDAFQRYLESPERRADARRLAAVRETVEALSASLVILTVAPVPSDARVRVDGHDVDLEQLPLTLDPGAHTIEASAPGYLSTRRELRLVPGERTRVELTLERARTVAPVVAPRPVVRAPSPVEPERPEPSPGERSQGFFERVSPVAWVGAGVALVAAGVATALWVDGNLVEADYVQRCGGESAPSACLRVWQDTQAELDARAGVVTALLGVTVVGGVVALIDLAVHGASRPAPSRASARPRVGSLVGVGSAGLRVVW